MADRIPSYPKALACTPEAYAGLFSDAPYVVVQEKYDGSQFSFQLQGADLIFRSKGKVIDPDHPEKMFAPVMAAITDRGHLIKSDAIYRGEFLAKPKHNVLCYERVPKGHFVLFDIQVGSSHLRAEEVVEIAKELDLEPAALFHSDTAPTFEQLAAWMSIPSTLGGPIEGLVVKRYDRFDREGKFVSLKLVSETFKEVHREAWKEIAPGQADVRDRLAATYATEARWAKAVQHLLEAGQLTGTPKDIGSLVREAQMDLRLEEEGSIKDLLFKWAWADLERRCVIGLPQWYKRELHKIEFGSEDNINKQTASDKGASDEEASNGARS